MSDKYLRAAAKMWHTVYKSNFYSTSTDNQRKWMNAIKDVINEVGTG